MFGRRVSAQELEQRYKLKHMLFDFYGEMLSELREHLEDKGFSWKTCKKSYLLRELRGHLKEKDWVGVANFAFFLADRERE